MSGISANFWCQSATGISKNFIGVSYRLLILRHVAAISWIERNRNISTLKEILGHSKIQQTEHYAKVTKEKVKSEAQRLNTEAPNSAIHSNVIPFRLAEAGKS